MIFIFGTRGREVKAGEGRFHCPQCEGERGYRLMKVKNYFTLFFIPIFPFSELGEYVECDTCKGTYKTGVLEETPEKILLRAIYADAVAGMPLQMITNKLINSASFSEEQAQAAVNHVAQQCVQKQCPSCQFTYLADANLINCTSCGTELR